MKATFEKGRYIRIKAETVAEAFALERIVPPSDVCPHCSQMKFPIIIDLSVLCTEEEEKCEGHE